eukprot:scaffold257837_cov33-Tisochrysis_lutea.AAC.5
MIYDAVSIQTVSFVIDHEVIYHSYGLRQPSPCSHDDGEHGPTPTGGSTCVARPLHLRGEKQIKECRQRLRKSRYASTLVCHRGQNLSCYQPSNAPQAHGAARVTREFFECDMCFARARCYLNKEVKAFGGSEGFPESWEGRPLENRPQQL